MSTEPNLTMKSLGYAEKLAAASAYQLVLPILTSLLYLHIISHSAWLESGWRGILRSLLGQDYVTNVNAGSLAFS